MNKKIICLGNGPVMSFTPYMAKLAMTLKHLNLDIDFVTWERESDITTAVDPDNVKVNVLMRKGNKESSRLMLLLFYFLWMFKLFFYVVSTNHDNKLFICSRFENCFPVWVASFFKKIEYIYADRDALHFTYKWPYLIKIIIKKVESLMAARAVVHLIPGESRDFTKLNNVVVVNNLPSSWVLNEAFLIHEKRNIIKKDKVIVYINGWLVTTRGLEQILAAITSKELIDFYEFIIAGDVDNKLLDAIKKMNNVKYLGRLSNEEALSYYYDSDVVISLYDPAIEINRKAEPNKWWDCVATNTPFITNNNIDTVINFDGLVKYWVIDYNEQKSLLKFLFYNKNEIKQHDKCLANVNIELWDVKISNLINKVINEK